tara:strand:+ start:65 stop:379 length:315 start_codon:yes stop_codon:yes gene_type:complete
MTNHTLRGRIRWLEEKIRKILQSASLTCSGTPFIIIPPKSITPSNMLLLAHPLRHKFSSSPWQWPNLAVRVVSGAGLSKSSLILFGVLVSMRLFDEAPSEEGAK